MFHIRALVVGENQWLLLAVVRALGLAGMQVEVASPALAPPVRWSRHCRRYWRLPGGWGEETQRAIERQRRKGIDVVVPADLPAVTFLSSHPTTFPVPNLEGLAIANDKARFSSFLAQHQLPHPATEVITDRACLRSRPFVSRLLKPAIGANSEGVRHVRTPEELDLYLSHEDRPGQLLVQEYLDGDDIDCSVLASHGEVLAWTCQRPLDNPLTRQMVEHPEALAVARSVVRALGYHGVGHFDMRFDAQGAVRVLELNPRFWMSLLYSVLAGVNFAELAVRVALGETVRQPAFTPGVYRQATFRPTQLLGTITGERERGRSFWQVLSDPLPQAAQRIDKLLGRYP